MTGQTTMKVAEKRMKAGNEKGFWSALYLIFLVTLAIMGLGAFMLIKSEGVNVASNMEYAQAQYAANGAAYYGLARLDVGPLDEGAALSIGGATVVLDSSKTEDEVQLRVSATLGKVESRLRIRLRNRTLSDVAILSDSTVNNVATRDSIGWPDTGSDLIVDNASRIPTVDLPSLLALSTAQGHDKAGNFTASPDYPSGSFYRPDGVTPEVTHVSGNFRVNGNRTAYGIFIVDGDVRLDGNARVEGVIYITSNGSSIIHGGGNPFSSSVTGGIIAEGELNASGSHVNVRHWPEYLRVFENFVPDPSIGFDVNRWEYL